MKRVLVVDDRQDNRYLLRTLLQGHGFEVDEARHGAEALARARQVRPELVISDLLMPVMDGYALLRQWKADEALREVPFIVYTATYTDPRDEQLALDLGADAFIVKPAEPEDFLHRMKAVLAAAGGSAKPARLPIAEQEVTLEAYNAALVRKLEQRAEQLEQRLAEHERAEAALKAANARVSDLQAAIDAHAVLSMSDLAGNITYANEHFCKVSGYSREELIGHNHRIVNSGTHPRAFFSEMWATISQGRVWTGEVCNRAKDGQLYWVDATLVPFLDAAGRPYQYAAIRTDITARKQAEASRREAEGQLRQMQKLQAVGTLAGGIAHDFNNIIGAILGYTALARQEMAPGGSVQEYLAQIQAGGERARSLVQRILGFSRPLPTVLTHVSMQTLITETQGMLRGTLPAVVTLAVHLPQEALHALVDPTQVEQVLLNLCTNAWHALGGSTGRIEIALDAVEFSADVTQRPIGLTSGRFVHVRVSDSGCGMDEATLARIFEPFFTTKPAGQGTGLGLAVAHGIISALNGAMTVQSQPGKGSTFHIYLPRVEPEAATPLLPALAEEPATVAAHGQVLFVDDDEIITLLGERALAKAGYGVTAFGDAHQALAAVRSQPRAFDLVVTDYNMPGLSGLELAREIKHIRADLPIVIGSGYVDDALRAEAAALGIEHLLNKERLAEELLPLVRRLLADHPPRR